MREELALLFIYIIYLYYLYLNIALNIEDNYLYFLFFYLIERIKYKL